MAAWSMGRKAPVEGQLQGPSPPPQKRHLYFTATLEIRDSILSAENAFLHSKVWGYAGLGGMGGRAKLATEFPRPEG